MIESSEAVAERQAVGKPLEEAFDMTFDAFEEYIIEMGRACATALLQNHDDAQQIFVRMQAMREGRDKLLAFRGRILIFLNDSTATRLGFNLVDTQAPSPPTPPSAPAAAALETAPPAKKQPRVPPEAGTYTSTKDYEPYLLRALFFLGPQNSFAVIQAKTHEIMAAEEVIKPNDLAAVASGQPRYKSQTFSAKKKLMVSGHIAQNQEGKYCLTKEGDALARQAEREKHSKGEPVSELQAFRSADPAPAADGEGGRTRRWRANSIG